MCKAFEEVRDEGALQKLLTNVMTLMEKMDWSLEKTMEILSVSDAEKKFLTENVKNN